MLLIWIIPSLFSGFPTSWSLNTVGLLPSMVSCFGLCEVSGARNFVPLTSSRNPNVWARPLIVIQYFSWLCRLQGGYVLLINRIKLNPCLQKAKTPQRGRVSALFQLRTQGSDSPLFQLRTQGSDSPYTLIL